MVHVLTDDARPRALYAGRKDIMTRAERKEAIRDIIESLSVAEDIVHDCMDKLEEIRDKKNAAKLDTISGKLYNIIHDLYGKTK